MYKAHYAPDRKVTPKERLLEVDLKEGWGPLCEYLGNEKPEDQFPRLNEGDTLKERVKDLQKYCLTNVIRNLALDGPSLVMGLVAVTWAWRGLT